MGVDAALRALAEPRRLEMIRLIRDEPRSVGEIGQHFDISQQAVSQHLHVLAGAGLVRVRQEGRRRLYVVDPQGLESLELFLAELFPSGLRRLKETVENDRGR
jgi:DNA-binding transcriptional ArsR family regulator